MSTRSMMAAPMMVPSAIRNMILRNGSPGASQPIEMKYGVSTTPSNPPTTAAMPMRAPVSMPAPTVEVDRSMAPSHESFADPMPPSSPAPMPEPSFATERRSSTGSVSARGKFMYDAVTPPSGPSTSTPSDISSRWYCHVPSAGSHDQRGRASGVEMAAAVVEFMDGVPSPRTG